ncbi:hypothetical protein [Neisseria sicca]|nr:hypothetical protein [Neisseria sicca]
MQSKTKGRLKSFRRPFVYFTTIVLQVARIRRITLQNALSKPFLC